MSPGDGDAGAPAWPDLPSPCYLVDLARLEANARLLAEVQARAGCRVLLALKGFALFAAFPRLRPYLVGTSASGLHEALLGHREFGGEVHVYSPAFRPGEVEELLPFAHHMVFNSSAQWERHRGLVAGCGRTVRCGLRVNPECSTGAVRLYDPCAPGSRLGTTAAQLHGADLGGISGLHFHTLCEQGADDLETTLDAFEEKFGHLLGAMEWVNCGGGHHITAPGYDIDRLCRRLVRLRETHGVEVYLEPGEAIALDAGVLVATVLDVIHPAGAGGLPPVALLDTSATAHMPDVLEMPYRPEVAGAGEPGELPFTYRLGGTTCLAGDVVGDYSFRRELRPGDRVVFRDMAHYTMVKNTTFNGIPLPAIALFDPERGTVETVRTFGYEDYRGRLS